MKILSANWITGCIAALMLGLAASPAAFAAFGVPAAATLKGTIQKIDYLHHALTINGQTYAVASDAKFSGVAGFSVLHIGMPVAYTLDTTTNNAMPGPGGDNAAPENNAAPQTDSDSAMITSIIWLPGGG